MYDLSEGGRSAGDIRLDCDISVASFLGKTIRNLRDRKAWHT